MKNSQDKVKSTPSPLLTAMPLSRRILHTVLIILGWVGYFYLSWATLRLTSIHDTLIFIMWYTLICLFTIPLVTFLWVEHNKNLARRYHGRRKAMPPIEERYDVDWKGKKIIADWPELRKARQVTIAVSENSKKYIIEQ